MLFASTHNRQSRNRNSTRTAQSVWRTNITGWFKIYYNIFRIITFLASIPLSSLSPLSFTLHSDTKMHVPFRGLVLFYDAEVYLLCVWYITPLARDVTIARHPSKQVTRQTLTQTSINVPAGILTHGRNVQTLQKPDEIIAGPNSMQPVATFGEDLELIHLWYCVLSKYQLTSFIARQ